MIEGIKRIQSRISEIETSFKKMGLTTIDNNYSTKSFADMLNDSLGKTTDSNKIEVKNVKDIESVEAKEIQAQYLTNKNRNNILSDNFDLYALNKYTVDMLNNNTTLPKHSNLYIEKAIEQYRKLSSKFPTDYDSIISEASKEYNVPEKLIKAVIKQESNFSPDAVSPKGAMGLMQIMPDTALELGIEVDELTDPYTNIMGGTKYLSNMLNRYNGRLDLSLSAYNAGPNLVDKVMRIPNIDETKNYVKNIIGYLK